MESGDGSGVQGTATEPLINKTKPASFSLPIVSISETEENRNQYLQISYNYDSRTIKDVPFGILFCLLVVCTFGFGIFASVNSNPHRFQVSAFVYNATSSVCSFDLDFPFVIDSIPRQTFSVVKASNLLNSKWSFWEISLWTLVITLILIAPLVLCLLFLLKRYTKQLVYISLPLFLILPIFINVYWFVACTLSSKCSGTLLLTYRIVVLIFVFLLIGVVVWRFVVNWHRIELTINVIGVASNALSRNLGLLGALPVLTLGLLVYFIPIILFLIYAKRNGKILTEQKRGVFLCVWEQDTWVPAYYALAILTMLWSITIMAEAQIYVISGSIAQWYFSSDDSRPKHAMRSSLRNAFGTSFGTICFSGLLIYIVRIVRFVVDSANQEDGSRFVNTILRCCANSLFSAVDFLNKFTINFTAITGEAYCKASKMTYELLIRNLLPAIYVDTISAQILSGIIILLSSAYAIVVCALLKGAMHLGDEAYLIALMAWCLLIVILVFVVHVLENVIDTVYICYAIDRDKGDMCRQDVHEVCDQLPIRRNRRAGFVPSTTFIA